MSATNEARIDHKRSQQLAPHAAKAASIERWLDELEIGLLPLNHKPAVARALIQIRRAAAAVHEAKFALKGQG